MTKITEENLRVKTIGSKTLYEKQIRLLKAPSESREVKGYDKNSMKIQRINPIIFIIGITVYILIYSSIFIKT